jgi:predicted transcriptional regulator
MATRTKRSGKTARTEIVGVRLDPRLRYLSEIAARRQRRTLSSFIEGALEDSLERITLRDMQGREKTIAQESGNLWDIDESDRFVYLAQHYPDMLTYDEQRVWKLVCENNYVMWAEREEDGTMHYEIALTRLREHWDNFCAVARGESDKSILPTLEKTPPPEGEGTIPF